jgi:peptidoglycan/LPS O-acetylase OafA/YrhL
VTATAIAPAPARASARAVPTKRTDIQALRAVAVVLVVLFHLWPARVSGGYVGVDVFFVISGFLITSHLIKAPPRGPRDVGAFWARRIRRLLPAAFVVIAATAIASWVFLPESQWRSLAGDAVASALYVENWNLAGGATDYLAAEDASSPFQQFWSLSVEEQFYIAWPLLIAAALALAPRRRSRSTLTAIGIPVAVVFVSSLAASAVLTATNPSAAYFVTHTRMWELALGGLLAVGIAARPQWFAAPSGVRALVAWAALAAIAWSALTYTHATPFPGTAALVPTVAAAAFLAARSEAGRWSPSRITGTAPVQFTGDVSYSIYLWHWPVIVILPYVTGQTLHWPLKLAIVAAVIPIAWLSKTWIEDPPQRATRFARPAWAAGFALTGMLAVMALGGAQVAVAADREQQAATRLAAAMADPVCAGAAAMAPGSHCDGGPHGAELLTTPAQAAADRPAPYADGCWTSAPFTARKVCTYGEQTNPTARIALVGNSHAGHWLPALQELATTHRWHITTYLVSACFPVDLPQDFAKAGASEGCRAWGRWAVEQTAGQDYDLVVTSARSGPSLTGVAQSDQVAAATAGYLDTLGAWADAGDRVLVLRDTPYGEVLTPDCVAQHASDLSACDGPQARREVPDAMADAARALRLETVQVADLTPYFCADAQCYSTIGGLIVYSDRSHMTTTFAKTLAPIVEPYVTGLLGPTGTP